MQNPVLDQERSQYLVARLSSSPEKRILLPAWPRPGPEKELPQVNLEVTWVRFSTLNHRTKSEQMRVADQQNRPDLFTADPNGEEAQTHQYRILADLEGFEELKADLRERGQQQPAVVTAEGILINGNRRTAALRSLFNDEDHQPSRYVSCLVLPADANRQEFVDLETELQIAREFKEDYTWVNEGLLIEEIFEREGRNWDKVARRMHLDVPTVRGKFEKLQQLHQLVALSQGTRHHADFVPNESAFTELAKHINGKPAQEAASIRDAYFLGTLTGVNYRTLRHLRRPDASLRVGNELKKDLTLGLLLDAGNEQQESDILDDVLGPSEGQHTGDLTSILSYMAQHSQSEEVELNGMTVATADLRDTIKVAVDTAAEEAHGEDLDQNAVAAPIRHLDYATNNVRKAADALPKARALQDWSEDDYAKQLARFKEMLARLDA